jgi:hypothetical protein
MLVTATSVSIEKAGVWVIVSGIEWTDATWAQIRPAQCTKPQVEGLQALPGPGGRYSLWLV